MAEAGLSLNDSDLQSDFVTSDADYKLLLGVAGG